MNQATPEGIGYSLMDEAARLCGSEGEFAIITASLTAANMNEWQKTIEARRASKYPQMKMAALRPCDDLKDKAQAEATSLLGAHRADLPRRLSCAAVGFCPDAAMSENFFSEVQVAGALWALWALWALFPLVKTGNW